MAAIDDSPKVKRLARSFMATPFFFVAKCLSQLITVACILHKKKKLFNPLLHSFV